MRTSVVRGLEVFSALIETGSATAAARLLGMSQPAVSQHILKLEQELGLPLFVRENGRMRPTETALTIHEEASFAFDGLHRVMNLARDIREMDRGQLRIAAPFSTGQMLLPRALKLLTAGHPQLRISVFLGGYDRIASVVAARQADLGFFKSSPIRPGGAEAMAHPAERTPSGFKAFPGGVESVEICNSGVSLAVAVNDPLARRGKLTLADLAKVPLVMIGRSRVWRDEVNVAFRRVGLVPRVVVETQSVDSACGFVAEGFGSAIVPTCLAGSLGRSDIRLIEIDLGLLHQFEVIYPARTGRHELAEDFAAALRQVMGLHGDEAEEPTPLRPLEELLPAIPGSRRSTG
jgi:DNA-binding transcriptional LysR family regulator